MTCRELIAYLQQFDPEQTVVFLPANIAERKCYKTIKYQLISDAGCPAILLEVTGEGPMDEVLEEVDAP